LKIGIIYPGTNEEFQDASAFKNAVIIILGTTNIATATIAPKADTPVTDIATRETAMLNIAAITTARSSRKNVAASITYAFPIAGIVIIKYNTAEVNITIKNAVITAKEPDIAITSLFTGMVSKKSDSFLL
jgi:hypothetical protein